MGEKLEDPEYPQGVQQQAATEQQIRQEVINGGKDQKPQNLNHDDANQEVNSGQIPFPHIEFTEITAEEQNQENRDHAPGMALEKCRRPIQGPKPGQMPGKKG
jgi:hypothetical protein